MNVSSSRARDLLACLGDSSRFRLVLHLLVSERCASDLALDVGLSQSCTTRHLQVLERAGIVCGARDGKRVLFRLCREKPTVDGLIAWALHEAEAIEAGSGLSARGAVDMKSRARSARSRAQSRSPGTESGAEGRARSVRQADREKPSEPRTPELAAVGAEPSGADSDGEAPFTPLPRSDFEDYLL